MYNPGSPQLVNAALSLREGSVITYAFPDDDCPPVFTVGCPANSFELCIHDEALRTFVRHATEALDRMGAPGEGEDNDDEPADPRPCVGEDHTHGMSHLSWMCIDDSCPIDAIVRDADHMHFRIGDTPSFELSCDAAALRRLALLGAQALAALDAPALAG